MNGVSGGTGLLGGPWAYGAGLDDVGYVYIPQACQQGQQGLQVLPVQRVPREPPPTHTHHHHTHTHTPSVPHALFFDFFATKTNTTHANLPRPVFGNMHRCPHHPVSVQVAGAVAGAGCTFSHTGAGSSSRRRARQVLSLVSRTSSVLGSTSGPGNHTLYNIAPPFFKM